MEILRGGILAPSDNDSLKGRKINDPYPKIMGNGKGENIREPLELGS
jgi:hypothetical protein